MSIQNIILFLMLCVGCDLVAVDGLSNATCSELLDYFSVKRDQRFTERMHLKEELYKIAASFIQRCRGESEDFNNQLARDFPLKIDTIDQKKYLQCHSRALLVQTESQEEKSEGFVVLLPYDFEETIIFKRVRELFFTTQYDDSDFGILLMVCLFNHKSSILKKTVAYIPLERRARHFPQIIDSIEGGGNKPSMGSRFDLLFCKIPGIKFWGYMDEFLNL